MTVGAFVPDFYSSREGTRHNVNTDDSSNTVPLSCSLHHNNLGEVGGTAVAKALETNTSLKELE